MSGAAGDNGGADRALEALTACVREGDGLASDAAAVHQCKRRVIDTMACALGAYPAEPSRIARAVAFANGGTAGGCVLGTRRRTSPELAAFANSVMGRYLDGNDTYPGGGGHPSDMIGGLLALATDRDASGRALLEAIVVGYEVYHALFAATRLRQHGLDNVYYTAVGVAAGGARLLALPEPGIRNAISLAATPNLALEATRRGKLSMWKGAAAGNAARNGVFAALLAEAGMTGPDKPFEDEKGLRGLVGDFAVGSADAPRAVTRSSMKYFLSEYHSQSPITAMLELLPRLRAEEVETIDVYTDRFTWYEIGSEPEKWRATTRETADHSLPYILSSVLLAGRFGDELFDAPWLADPRVPALCDRIRVHERPEYTARFPAAIPCEIVVATKSGQRHDVRIEYPRGHVGNPMSDAEVDDKFRILAGRVLAPDRVAPALDALWRLDEAERVSDVAALLATAAHEDGNDDSREER